MKFLFVLSGLLFFVGCGKFEYHRLSKKESLKQNHRAQIPNVKQNHHAQIPNANRNNNNSDKLIFDFTEGLDLKSVDTEKSDFESLDAGRTDFKSVTKNLAVSLAENAKEAKRTRQCAYYRSGIRVSSFGAYNNAVKNCIAYAVDRALQPMCIHEKDLKDLKKEYRNDEKSASNIDEALRIAAAYKDRFTSNLYRLSDRFDANRAANIKKFEEKNGGPLEKKPIPAGDYKFSTFANFFQERSLSVCPSFKRR